MSIRLNTLCFILASMCLVGAIGTAQEDPAKKVSRITLDHIGRLVNVGAPQFSPDGKSIVFVVSRKNYEKNRSEAELVLIDIASRKQRVLTQGREGLGQPHWSPSGDQLAFLAKAGTDKEAKVQLFVMPMAGGDARKITEAPEGVSDFAWKPDGKEFAYTMQDEENRKGKHKDDDAFEVGNNDFLATSAARPTHAWLIAAEGGKAKRLTSGTWGLASNPPPAPPSSPLVWTPDGKSLLIVRQELPHDGDNDKTRVQVLDVASGKIRDLTGKTDLESYPTLSPDGSQIAYCYPRDGDPTNINDVYLVPLTGGEGHNLTRQVDRAFYQSFWMPDGKSLLIGANDANRVSLWLQPIDGTTAKRLELGKVNPNWFFAVDVSISHNGAIVFAGNEAQRPTELYYLPNSDSVPERLTNFNAEVAGLDLGRVDTIEWTGPNDFKENGILTYPPGFEKGKKYPLVLLIHGGPTSASTEHFSTWAQLFASHGYMVFEPNYRGSDNLGNTYQKAVVKDTGDGPGKDVMAGLEAVKKLGFVDESRIAVTGWSYGGYMTSWLIGHYHCWKTAVAGAALTDWHDHYNLSDSNVTNRYSFGGSPWKGDSSKLYTEQSPITYARSITTPTLILCNTGDARVPITQSYRLYHALKDNNVPVKFIAYPVAGHFPSDPIRSRDVSKRWLAWLDEYLK